MILSKRKIYIGCSLTHSPEDFKQKIIDFKLRLRSEGYEVMEFLGLTAGTPKDVYEEDIVKNVGGCDVFVAVCDYPAIGLGYEMAVADEKLNIPTLALAEIGSKVTRLIKGIPQKNYSFVEYKDLDDMVKITLQFIERVGK